MPLGQISTSNSPFNGRVSSSFRKDRTDHCNSVGRYGAPMGWSNTPTMVDPSPVKMRLRRVRLLEGYDLDGFYYGGPSDLWDAAPYRRRKGIDPFRFRAPNHEAAKAEVRKWLPNATFDR